MVVFIICLLVCASFIIISVSLGMACSTFDYCDYAEKSNIEFILLFCFPIHHFLWYKTEKYLNMFGKICLMTISTALSVLLLPYWLFMISSGIVYLILQLFNLIFFKKELFGEDKDH